MEERQRKIKKRNVEDVKEGLEAKLGTTKGDYCEWKKIIIKF